MFYKVLVNGSSCHGGNMAWSLPTSSEPGEWHTHEGEAVMCKSGFHITNTPSKWYKTASAVYEAECENFVQENTSEKKFLFKKVRLVRELTDEDLGKLDVFRKTTQVIYHSFATCENATIFAFGSTIRSYGRSLVFAKAGSKVKAFDSSIVFAEAWSQVELYDNATVSVSSTSASVNAWGRSKVFTNSYSRILINHIPINSMIDGKINKDTRAACNGNTHPGVRLFDAATAIDFQSKEVPSYVYQQA